MKKMTMTYKGVIEVDKYGVFIKNSDQRSESLVGIIQKTMGVCNGPVILTLAIEPDPDAGLHVEAEGGEAPSDDAAECEKW